MNEITIVISFATSSTSSLSNCVGSSKATLWIILVEHPSVPVTNPYRTGPSSIPLVSTGAERARVR